MKPFRKILFILFILILVSGCSSVNKNEAEAKAVEFVNEKVKFFAREENSTLDLPQYSIDSVTSYQENKNWVVVIHVSAKVENETKKNDLTITLNKEGEAIEFNGREIPKQFR
jgi:uncharacterized protein YceK